MKFQPLYRALLCSAALAALVSARPHITWDNRGMHGYSSTLMTVTPGDYSTNTVAIDGKDYLNVHLETGGLFAPKGFPNLPCIYTSVIIPDNREVNVEVLSIEYTDIPVSGIAPAKGRIYRNADPASVPYVFNEVYQQDSWYPASIASVREPFIHRDFRGCPVRICPFQYNPVKKVLRVYSKASLKVSAAGLGKINVFRRAHVATGIDAEFSQTYEKEFLNYTSSSYTIVPEEGSMMIICPSIFMSAIQPLVEWKKKKGIEVEVVDMATAGSTAAALKTYIANAYNVTGSTLKFILLVGDADQVPTPTISYLATNPADGGGADIIYGEIEGTDCYSELLIGRFSGTTVADIQTQVDRSIYYETRMTPSDTWLSNILLSASNDPTKNLWNETDADFINHEYDTISKAGFANVYRHNQNGVGGTGCEIGTAASVTTLINTGISFWNYSGHGNKTSYPAVNFTASSAAALSNTNRYFYTYAIACNTGEFSTGTTDCLGEALMKSHNNNKPIGCIGCYLGSIAQVWDPPYAAVREILEISLERYPDNKKYTLGGIMINGGMAAYETYSDNSSRSVVESFVLLGDPNLNIYTKTPTALTITHQAIVDTGEQTVVVNGTNGATVCLFSSKLKIQQSAVLTNGSASFSITADGKSGDTIYVTGTKFNCSTYQGFMLVSQNTQIDRHNALLAANGSPLAIIRLYNLQGKQVAMVHRKGVVPERSLNVTGYGARVGKGAYLAIVEMGWVKKTLPVLIP
jgi:gingipain R